MKRFIFFLLVILLLSILFFFYINRFLIPLQLKDFLTAKIQTLSHRPVSIEQIHFYPVKGFVVKNVVIGSQRDVEESLIKIKELHLGLQLWPLLRKEVVIPSVTIIEPEISIAYYGQNE